MRRGGRGGEEEQLASRHARARGRGLNPIVYAIARSLVQLAVELLCRPRRHGRRHVTDGAVILASNHRSFLDPLVIGCSVRRPVFFMAKQELFRNRPFGWLLSRIGAFPVRRGESDDETTRTALELLAHGQAVVMFPEGARIRPGALGTPKRGVGRLALESGAPVVPVAVCGTERARRGWLLRPVRVGVRFGRPLRFPRVERPSPGLAEAVTERIWACVALQWEWLGGAPPLRTAAVVGAGAAARATAELLARAGLEVELGSPAAPAERLAATRPNRRRPSGAPSERPSAPRSLEELDLERADLIAIAVPGGSLPAVVAELGPRIAPGRSAALVVSPGIVPGLGSTPAAHVADRLEVRGVAVLAGPLAEGGALYGDAPAVLASVAADLRRELRELLRRAGLAVRASADVAAAELAASSAAASAPHADGGHAGDPSAHARLDGVGAAGRSAGPRAA